ncbi:lipopolysaccharide biosynthesis protein [Colwellia sp. TT2012]|uniref:lipopolysaccharide biosynthesis protein n=1 Tax=Colwellia sp. TT2012 TaxID=1720342 RepID=UPI00070FBA26|nr:hypothetical protein [Colwellia sp. TT2012]
MSKFKIDNLKHYATTSFGVMLAQLVSFFSVPFIAKLSGADIYGQYSYLLSITAVLSVFVSLRLEFTVFNISDTRFRLLDSIFSKLTFCTAFILSLLAFVIAGDSATNPIMVFLAFFAMLYATANFEFTIQKNIKQGLFSTNALTRISRAVFFPIIFYVLFLLVELSPFIIMLAFALANILPVKLFNKKSVNSVSEDGVVSDSKQVVISAKSVIKYLIPAHLLNRYSGGMFLIIVGTLLDDNTALAYYSLAVKFVIAPAVIIVAAVADVIKREILVSPKRALVNYGKISVLSGLAVSLYILGVIFLGAPVITFAMGEEWLPAVNFAIALTPYLLALVVFSPITYVYVIFDKQKYDYYWQLFNAGFVTLFLWLGLQQTLLTGVWYFSIASAFSLTISASICIYFTYTTNEIKVKYDVA